MPMEVRFAAALPSAEGAETADFCAYSVAVGLPLLSCRSSETTPALPNVAPSLRFAVPGRVNVIGPKQGVVVVVPPEVVDVVVCRLPLASKIRSPVLPVVALPVAVASSPPATVKGMGGVTPFNCPLTAQVFPALFVNGAARG